MVVAEQASKVRSAFDRAVGVGRGVAVDEAVVEALMIAFKVVVLGVRRHRTSQLVFAE